VRFQPYTFTTQSLRRTLGVVAMVCGCLIGTAASAEQIISLSTPAGLTPGDHFRFLFLTAGTTDATSTDIAAYNSFVNSEAGGATYGGSTVTWKAIGSTSTVDARDNVGGFGDSEPVYLVNGTLFAKDLTTNAANNGLWSGVVLTQPKIGIDGSVFQNVRVWTGSSLSGNQDTGFVLGDSVARFGLSDYQPDSWLYWNFEDQSSFSQMYGISFQLTVAGPSPVPEIDPAGMGSVLALVTGALGLLERRRLKVKLA